MGIKKKIKKIHLFVLIIVFTVFLVSCENKENNDNIAYPKDDAVTDNTSGVENMTFTLTSTAFKNNELIPSKYTCKGENVNPPLQIFGKPIKTKAMALIVEDPDAPAGNWVHWIVFNIDPSVTEIKENSIPLGGFLGRNNFGKILWGGPCPPSGTHRYFFRLYALDAKILLGRGATKEELFTAMDGHVIEKTELMGLFGK